MEMEILRAGACLHSNQMELLSVFKDEILSFSGRPHFPRVNEHTDVGQEALLVSIVFSHFEIIFVIHLPNKIKGPSKTKTKFTCASSSLSGFNYHLFFDITKKARPEHCSIVTFDVLPSGGVSGSLHVYASTSCLYGMFTVAGTVW